MTDGTILVQWVNRQRTEPPTGLRIWWDGVVERCSSANPLPSATERLDKDTEFLWQIEKTLSADQVESIQTAIRHSGIFEMYPVLLINYCKEDPGSAIWIANLDGKT